MTMVHEAAHALHIGLYTGEWEPFSTALAIFMEGLAVAVTPDVFPTACPDELLWVGGDRRAWLADCEAALQEASTRMLESLESEDHDEWFLVRAARDLPPRIGYVVSDRVVSKLRRTHTLAELARWSDERAAAEVRAVLAA